MSAWQTASPIPSSLFFSASGRVEGCRITGFRGSALGNETNHWGYGVQAINPYYLGGGPVDIQVLRSTFADNVVSIQLIGDAPPNLDPTLLRTTFTVNDNTIVGNGPDANGRQYGIHILAGAGGEVKRNTISDCAYIGTADPTPFSFGILAIDDSNFGVAPLAALQPVQYEGNVLLNNQIHMNLIRADGSVVANNSFEGAGPGYRPAGLVFSGGNVLVATNRFSDMETGILLFGGGDPVSPGQYLGIASNAVLTANGFCNVATNYVYEPQTTHTEQDTLLCPEPVLDITRSVLLSWPYSYNGYSLETATNCNGPWTTSDATVFRQDGRNSAAVPADKPEQIYRLVKP